MSGTFTAKYHGTCADCKGRIEPGDEIVFAGDKVTHAEGDCASVGTVVAAGQFTGDVCNKCWTAVSVSGACACID